MSGDANAARAALVPGIAQPLDELVTRLVAPNAGPLTGPGTNTYLIGRREMAVIDPGPDDPAHVQRIAAAGSGRIRWILCTHTHLDHSPAAAALKRLTGAPIAGMTPPNTDHDDRLVLDRTLADGVAVTFDGLTLRAVATPGHASNHVCFLLENSGMLFTGDHIMQGSTVVIWPPDGNMRSYLDSLRRLQELNLSCFAPGHGQLILDPYDEVDVLIRHRLRREQKVIDALLAVSGSATLDNLLLRVYDDVAQSLHSLAARSLQAHLEKLVEEGEVAYREGRYSLIRK